MAQRDVETLGADGTPPDLFRISFKTYKSIKCIRDLLPKSSKNEGSQEEEVIVLNPWKESEESPISNRSLNFNETCSLECQSRFGLRPPSTWKVYNLNFPEGLVLISNPFNREGQRYWIKRSVLDFPKDPFITNIDNLEIKERKLVRAKLDRDEFYQKLRWVTFGYHHNWDTKIYAEDSKSEFPQDLADLTNFMARVLGFSNFKAEAAIANYYHLDSTLSGHVDRSEVNQCAPLFSLSFGQPAVFLIGGRTKCVKPQAVLLRSGDIAVMSGESRLSYHGVPRIVHTPDEPWNSNSCTPESEDGSCSSKKPRLDIDFSSADALIAETKGNCEQREPTSDRQTPTEPNDQNLKIYETEWSDFLNTYVSKSRINLNIRQVLFPGQTQLCQTP